MAANKNSQPGGGGRHVNGRGRVLVGYGRVNRGGRQLLLYLNRQLLEVSGFQHGDPVRIVAKAGLVSFWLVDRDGKTWADETLDEWVRNGETPEGVPVEIMEVNT